MPPVRTALLLLLLLLLLAVLRCSVAFLPEREAVLIEESCCLRLPATASANWTEVRNGRETQAALTHFFDFPNRRIVTADPKGFRSIRVFDEERAAEISMQIDTVGNCLLFSSVTHPRNLSERIASAFCVAGAPGDRLQNETLKDGVRILESNTAYVKTRFYIAMINNSWCEVQRRLSDIGTGTDRHKLETTSLFSPGILDPTVFSVPSIACFNWTAF